LKSIDKSLEKLYPVTIVENDTFFVFDLDVLRFGTAIYATSLVVFKYIF